MTTYPIQFCFKLPQTENLSLSLRQAVSQSPFTFAQQTVNTAAQWHLQWSWPQMGHADAEAVSGWIDSLQGQVGTFTYAPRSATPYGTGGLTLAQPAYRFNSACMVGGFQAGSATNLTIGRWGQVGNQLIRVVSAPLTADGSGQAEIGFAPALRADQASGAGINFVNPSGVFRLAASEGLGFTITPDRLPTFPTMNAVEAVE